MTNETNKVPKVVKNTVTFTYSPRPTEIWIAAHSVKEAKQLVHTYADKGYRIISGLSDYILMKHDLTGSTVEIARDADTPMEVVDWLYGLEDHLDIRTHDVAMEYIDKEES